MRPAPNSVAVLGHSLWQELGSDPEHRRQAAADSAASSRTVIGVMPRGFWFPSPQTRIWTAAQIDAKNRVRPIYTLVGRVADGAVDGAACTAPARRARGDARREFSVSVRSGTRRKAPAITPVRENFVGKVRPSTRGDVRRNGCHPADGLRATLRR